MEDEEEFLEQDVQNFIPDEVEAVDQVEPRGEEVFSVSPGARARVEFVGDPSDHSGEGGDAPGESLPVTEVAAPRPRPSAIEPSAKRQRLGQELNAIEHHEAALSQFYDLDWLRAEAVASKVDMENKPAEAEGA